jgi:hypothetical protein
MSQHLTTSPSEPANRLAIRELIERLRALRRSSRCERPDVSLYSRYALRRVHERQGSEAFAGAVFQFSPLLSGAWLRIAVSIFPAATQGYPLEATVDRRALRSHT